MEQLLFMLIFFKSVLVKHTAARTLCPFRGLGAIQNAPGTEWNCKCDLEETDESVTDNSAVKPPSVPLGLEGNPAQTGEVFTDKASYIRNARSDAWTDIKPTIRSSIRKQYEGYKETVETSIGKVLIDEITMIEVSKGSATDKSYFLKQEIARNIEKYVDKMQRLPDEAVDLGHNNPNSIYYRRKTKFDTFQVFQLFFDDIVFTIKMGVFKNNKGLHVYSITG